jgi:hypothetical protein
MKTTLNRIRKHNPCKEGWSKLLTYLGKTSADDKPLEIATIVKSNGLDGALWCLRAVEGEDRKVRLFAVWCARRVQHLMTDPRSLKALDGAEAYANGTATLEELRLAWGAARVQQRMRQGVRHGLRHGMRQRLRQGLRHGMRQRLRQRLRQRKPKSKLRLKNSFVFVRKQHEPPTTTDCAKPTTNSKPTLAISAISKPQRYGQPYRKIQPK